MDTAKTALALSVVGLVPSIYGTVLPSVSDVRGHADDRGHLAACEQYAAVTAGAVVVVAAALTRSREVALAGIVAVVAFSSAYTHARKAAP